VLLLTDYLSRRPDVDPRRIFLIGGSLGAVVAVVAGGIDARPAAVVLLYGGGNLGPLIAHTLEHPAQRVHVPHWATPVVGRALACGRSTMFSSSARARASGRRGGTSRPVTPCVTSSGLPWRSVATTGTATASASRSVPVRPRPAYEASTQQSDAARISGMSSR